MKTVKILKKNTKSDESIYSLLERKSKTSKDSKTSRTFKKEKEIFNQISMIKVKADFKKMKVIEQAIYDNLEIYKSFRKLREEEIAQIEKLRRRIEVRKVTKKKRRTQLAQNGLKKLRIIINVLLQTIGHFKKQFYESDLYRLQKLFDLQKGIKLSRFEIEKIEYRQAQMMNKSMFYRITQMAIERKKEKLQELIYFSTQKEKNDGLSSNISKLLDGEGSHTLKEGLYSHKQRDGQNSHKSPRQKTNDLGLESPLQRKDKFKESKSHEEFEVKQIQDLSPRSKANRLEKVATYMQNKIRHALRAEVDRVISEKQIYEMYTAKIIEFLQSPFVDDRVFAMNYVLQISRDSLDTKKNIVEKVFYEDIFDLIIKGDKNELIVFGAFQILINLLEDEENMMRLASEGFLLQVYKKYAKYATYLIEGRMPEKEESDSDEQKDEKNDNKDEFGLLIKNSINEKESNSGSNSSLEDDSPKAPPPMPQPMLKKHKSQPNVQIKSTKQRQLEEAAQQKQLQSQEVFETIKENLKIKLYKEISGNNRNVIERTVLCMSTLTKMIASKLDQPEFFQLVQDLPLIQFCKTTIEQPAINKIIKNQSLLALEQLTYSQSIQDQYLKEDCVGLLIDLAMKEDQSYSSYRMCYKLLSHLALIPLFFNELINKDIYQVFDGVKKIKAPTDPSQILLKNQSMSDINLNLAWIFLTLCNNGVEGKELMEKNITKDMFLVGCNPSYENARNIVVASFAKLGLDEKKVEMKKNPIQILIQNEALNGIQKHIKDNLMKAIEQFLIVQASRDSKKRFSALKGLKDLILFNKKVNKQISNKPIFRQIIDAFVNGCVGEDVETVMISIQALSYLITNKFLYSQYVPLEEKRQTYLKMVLEKQQKVDHFNKKSQVERMEQFGRLIKYQSALFLANKELEKIDIQMLQATAKIKDQGKCQAINAILLQTGHSDSEIRSTAFSILNDLTLICSKFKTVKAQVSNDMRMPQSWEDKGFYKFIQNKTSEQKQIQKDMWRSDTMFQEYELNEQHNGFYVIVKLSQDPNEEQVQQGMDAYLKFIDKKRKFLVNKSVTSCSHSSSERTLNQRLGQSMIKDLSGARILEGQDSGIHEKESEEVMLNYNERYFFDVFQSLKHSRNPLIIQKLVQVINYYTESLDLDNRHQIVNPSTILWLLQNIDFFISKSEEERYISTICALSIFAIVDQQSNSLKITYEEYAIQKNFSKLLTNLGVFQNTSWNESNQDDQENSSRSNGQSSDYSSNKNPLSKEQEGTYQSLESQSDQSLQMTFRQKQADDVKKDQNQAKDTHNQVLLEFFQKKKAKGKNGKLKIKTLREDLDSSFQQHQTRSQLSKYKQSFMAFRRNQSNLTSPNISSKQVTPNSGLKIENVTKLSTQMNLQIFNEIAQLPNAQIEEMKEDNLSIPSQSFENESGDISYSQISELKISVKDNPSNPVTIQSTQQNLFGQEAQESFVSQEFTNLEAIQSSVKNTESQIITEIQAQESLLSEEEIQAVPPIQAINDILSKVNPHKEVNSSEFSQNKSQHGEDSSNAELEYLVETHLKDSLIKSFMIIFTNDQTQYLLKNKDLLEIAFNCMENSLQITDDAQKNVSRLIAKIIRYQKVQNIIFRSNIGVVDGMIDLLVNAKKLESQFAYLLKKDESNCSRKHSNIDGRQSFFAIVTSQKIIYKMEKKLQTLKVIIRACYSLSQSIKFPKIKRQSLSMLKAIFSLAESQNFMDCLTFSDKLQMVLTIKNLSLGSKTNSTWVIDSGSYQTIFMIIQEGHQFCQEKIDKETNDDQQPYDLHTLDVANHCNIIIADIAHSLKNIKVIMTQSQEQFLQILLDMLYRSQCWFQLPNVLKDEHIDQIQSQISSQNKAESNQSHQDGSGKLPKPKDNATDISTRSPVRVPLINLFGQQFGLQDLSNECSSSSLLQETQQKIKDSTDKKQGSEKKLGDFSFNDKSPKVFQKSMANNSSLFNLKVEQLKQQDVENNHEQDNEDLNQKEQIQELQDSEANEKMQHQIFLGIRQLSCHLQIRANFYKIVSKLTQLQQCETEMQEAIESFLFSKCNLIENITRDLQLVIDHLIKDYSRFENKGCYLNERNKGDQNFMEFMQMVPEIKDLHVQIFSNIIECLTSLQTNKNFIKLMSGQSQDKEFKETDEVSESFNTSFDCTFKFQSMKQIPTKMKIDLLNVYGAMMLESLNHRFDHQYIVQGCQSIIGLIIDFKTSESQALIDSVLFVVDVILNQFKETQSETSFEHLSNELMTSDFIRILNKSLDLQNGQILLITLQILSRVQFDPSLEKGLTQDVQIASRRSQSQESIQPFIRIDEKIHSLFVSQSYKQFIKDEQLILSIESQIIKCLQIISIDRDDSVELIIESALNIDYQILLELDEDDQDEESDVLNNTPRMSFLNPQSGILSFDKSEENSKLETTIETLLHMIQAHLKEQDSAFVSQIISGGIVDLCQKVINTFLNHYSGEESQDIQQNQNSFGQGSIDVTIFTTQGISLLRNTVKIMLALSSTARAILNKSTAISIMSKLCLNTNFFQLIKQTLKILDYQLQGSVMKTIGNILIMNSETTIKLKYKIQEKAVNEGFFSLMLANINQPVSQYIHVKRICQSVLQRLQQEEHQVVKYHMLLESKKEEVKRVEDLRAATLQARNIRQRQDMQIQRAVTQEDEVDVNIRAIMKPGS